MQLRDWINKYWFTAALFVGFWTVIGLCFASQFYVASSLFGDHWITWRQAIGITLADWYVWAVLSVPVIWFARRFPLHQRNWEKLVVIHFTASTLVCVAYVVLRSGVGQLQGPSLGMPLTFSGSLERLFVKNSFFNLLVYWIIVTVTLAFDYYRKFNEREWRTAELERRLAEAKLMALQMQLNPHFLFNTLHTISALMHKDVDAADRTIARLSELLRLALENTEANEVSLREEIGFLRRYLEIEQTRFGDRLTVTMDISEETWEARVPNLVLQPLVENAIRHGIEPNARPGVVELRARREGGMLLLEVRDNGRGIPKGGFSREGVGVANTRARLVHLYGKRQSFEYLPGEAQGLTVRLTLPFQDAEGGPPGSQGA